MPRAPFNVLVYPYERHSDGGIRYAILRRSDEAWWQAIAGGGEDNETPMQAAARETLEETGIPVEDPLLELTTVIPVPVTHFEANQFWGDELYVIPQYCFGVLFRNTVLVLSTEHTEYRWLNYEGAQALLRYDGDRTALWELNSRLIGLGPRCLGKQGL
jgi:dihydroneopterin triphosphate diphosphatase